MAASNRRGGGESISESASISSSRGGFPPLKRGLWQKKSRRWMFININNYYENTDVKGSKAVVGDFHQAVSAGSASIRSSKQPEQPEQLSSGETRLKRRNEHQAVEGINRTLSSEWRQEDPVPKQEDFSQVAPNDPSNYEGSLSDFPGEKATISSQQPLPDDTESQLEVEYHRRHRNFFKPGKVFDIQSKENAGLHGRIMVVIRQNDESFLCLGVKTYNEETLEKADDRFYWSHVVVDANAYSENAKLDGGDRRKPICMDETGLPQNSWVNLEEIFTLSEKHIMVREYGTIEQGGLNDLVEYAKEVLQDNRWRDMPMWKG